MGGNILLDHMVQLGGSSAQFGLGCSTASSATVRPILPFDYSSIEPQQVLQSAIAREQANTENCTAASFLELLAGRPLAVEAAESAASQFNLQNSLAMHVEQSSRKTLFGSNLHESVPISPLTLQLTAAAADASPNNTEGRPSAVIMATSNNSPGSCTASSNDYSAYCASLIHGDNKTNNNNNTIQNSSCITTSRDQQSTCSSSGMRAPAVLPSPVSYLFPATEVDGVLTRQASNASLLQAQQESKMGRRGAGAMPESDTKLVGAGCRMAEADGEKRTATPAAVKKKRKRSRTTKNLEELESQRMTHIAVERNRRRQMNDHLNALRALMPPSYIQRGDQASIVGGAIRFVEELEQVVQCLHLQKRIRLDRSLEQLVSQKITNDHALPTYNNNVNVQHSLPHQDNNSHDERETSYACFQTPIANAEVKMVSPSSILLKILAHKQPRQLLNTLAVLNKLQLKVVHLSITTIDLTTLYSFNLEMEQTCQLQRIDEITKQLELTYSVKSNNGNDYVIKNLV